MLSAAMMLCVTGIYLYFNLPESLPTSYEKEVSAEAFGKSLRDSSKAQCAIVSRVHTVPFAQPPQYWFGAVFILGQLQQTYH